MAGSGLEGAQGIQRWQATGHGGVIPVTFCYVKRSKMPFAMHNEKPHIGITKNKEKNHELDF
jgi:hypothetical protein